MTNSLSTGCLKAGLRLTRIPSWPGEIPSCSDNWFIQAPPTISFLYTSYCTSGHIVHQWQKWNLMSISSLFSFFSVFYFVSVWKVTLWRTYRMYTKERKCRPHMHSLTVLSQTPTIHLLFDFLMATTGHFNWLTRIRLSSCWNIL